MSGFSPENWIMLLTVIKINAIVMSRFATANTFCPAAMASDMEVAV